MPDFTPTQGRYLSFVAAYIEGFGEPPAESEIAAALKVSPPSVNQMMKKLAQKGLITRKAGVPRSIEILVDRDAIPRWTGKRLTRTQMQWVQDEPNKKRPNKKQTKPARASSPQSVVYQFKITLRGTQPPIWRRIETLDVSLANLHEAIQIAMGWTDSHLHAFEVGRVQYTDPRMFETSFPDPFLKSYAGLKISDLVKQHGPKLKLLYLYDFGDGWEHTVALEKMTDRKSKVSYPRCLTGKR
ncbi:MAG: MarR family transcriptional regulator, partial [Novipirellula sp. JB048]